MRECCHWLLERQIHSFVMKVMSVVGARPQFVKLAPIHKAMQAADVNHVIVHTGQHYDTMLSEVFFEDLGIERPGIQLGIGSGSHGVQTGRMLSALDEVFVEHAPQWVLVYGDTNSTAAAALSAVKMHIRVAHLEAGLRSFNRRMPEEHNRVVTDHVADLLLAPTETAMRHLNREGLASRSLLVGDVMTDVLYEVRNQVQGAPSPLISELSLVPENYYVATLHRPDNTDDPSRLASIIEALGSLDKPVVLLAHPRLVAKATNYGINLEQGSIIPYGPLAYPVLISTLLSSRGVITDSGGLQKEAFLLRVPCTTVRAETEWVETTDLDWNVLANAPEDIKAAVERPQPLDTSNAPYGDGFTAARVVEALSQRI